MDNRNLTSQRQNIVVLRLLITMKGSFSPSSHPTHRRADLTPEVLD
ncbi:hypothetical protein L914_14458 [Phytophthora nicotianae]|uniref:Uncharacterized protein n=1 Tax=Phytophthora nicotianae TaxID=4792 RepID=W2MSX8_PHYNI|nr:hypothetical protein L914_14458 [Phytophthora nicotianae]